MAYRSRHSPGVDDQSSYFEPTKERGQNECQKAWLRAVAWVVSLGLCVGQLFQCHAVRKLRFYHYGRGRHWLALGVRRATDREWQGELHWHLYKQHRGSDQLERRPDRNVLHQDDLHRDGHAHPER